MSEESADKIPRQSGLKVAPQSSLGWILFVTAMACTMGGIWFMIEGLTGVVG